MVRKTKDQHEAAILQQNNNGNKRGGGNGQNSIGVRDFQAQLQNSFAQAGQKIPQHLQQRMSKLPFMKRGGGDGSPKEDSRYVGMVKPGKWLYQLSY